MIDIAINIPITILAAAASFALGMLWWSPVLFGRQWIAAMKAAGKDPEQLKKDTHMGASFGLSALGWLVASCMLAVMLQTVGAMGVVESLKLAGLLWLGFTIAFDVNSLAFEKRPLAIFLINNGYYLVGLLIMAAIMGVWA